MPHIYLIPAWFLGYDVALQFTFAIITMAVSIFAFKVYKLSDQKQSRLFGIAFLLFSIAYFVQSAMNYAVMTELNEGISRLIQLNNVAILNFVGIYTHILLFITALVTLVYMSFKTRGPKLWYLVFLLSLFALLLSANKLYAYYIISSILLIFVTSHYLMNFLGNKQGKTLMVFVAFTFLLFGSIHFIFSVNHAVFYFIAHGLEMIAYILILIDLILIVKK
ncbi:MAG: hypothetical protein V1837_04070 [Candidatus Woesearchaeota archaeon]